MDVDFTNPSTSRDLGSGNATQSEGSQRNEEGQMGNWSTRTFLTVFIIACALGHWGAVEALPWLLDHLTTHWAPWWVI